MKLLLLIIEFEWRQLLRQPTLVLMLCFIFLAGIYGIYTGKAIADKQLTAIDSIQLNYKTSFADQIKKMMGDTTTRSGITAVMQTRLPEVIDFRVSPYAIHYPRALSVLAIGQRDLLPYYEVIKRHKSYLEPPNADLANPEKLATGNFDLAFVLVYLMPLVMIVLCHNVISQEKEQGTFKLLIIQGVSIHRILLYKILFRSGLVIVISVLLSVIGFGVAGSIIALPVQDALWWLLIVVLYLAFWLALCYLLVHLGNKSAVTALYLLAAWITFLMVLPALFNVYISLKHPVTLRSDLASVERQTSEEIWEMPPDKVVAVFYHNNPHFKKLLQKADTAVNISLRATAYYDLLERSVKHKETEYRQQTLDRLQTSAKLAFFNPAELTGKLLYDVAATGLGNHQQYMQQALAYQQQWKYFINVHRVLDKAITPADLTAFPSFQMQEDPLKEKRLTWAILPLLTTIALILLITFFIRKSVTVLT